MQRNIFISQFSLVALTNRNFTRAGRFLQMRKSCLETLHLPTAVWNRRKLPIVTTKRAVLQRAWGYSQGRSKSSWLLMSRKWEHFYFMWNLLITQPGVSGLAGRPECCRSPHSGDLREATDIRESTSTAGQREFPTSNLSPTPHTISSLSLHGGNW